MLHILNYERPQTLEEAYQLRQKKGSAVLGGTGWLRLGEHTLRTAIDLSGLGLRYIKDEGDSFLLGAYTTLRDLETSVPLNEAFGGAFADAVGSIVGIQFRNCATLGGSLYGRFGFSDVLTLLLALDCEVHLYKEGWVPVETFAARNGEPDILTELRIYKNRRVKVLSQRLNANDFPSVTIAVSKGEDGFRSVIGARPCRAKIAAGPEKLTLSTAPDFAKKAADAVSYGNGMRGSAPYRRQLAEVLTRRAALSLLQKEAE